MAKKDTAAQMTQEQLDFPVVGIGASAGGLEALTDFFKSLAPDSGAGYVVIQHLAPDHKSLMDELLARVTRIPISIAEDGMQIERNHIYLIPPGSNLTVYSGSLQLSKPKARDKLNMPIDVFLTSLARDQRRNAIGIILSGTGSDGTSGMRVIKEHGGIVMAQNRETAKFDSMPGNSIDTGIMDFILPPSELAEVIANYTRHPFVVQSQVLEHQIEKEKHKLNRIFAILRNTKGLDFSDYKDSTLLRRLEKRLTLNRLDSLGEYVRFLEENAPEVDTLFADFLIGVTSFFRDGEAFETLNSEVIPIIIEGAPGSEIRVWVAGCSTGEEAYSIAILILEKLHQMESDKTLKVFATDVDEHALTIAGNATYSSSIARGIPSNLLSKYFETSGQEFRARDRLRKSIVFARHDLLKDPPFSKIDLVSCRNLLIYLKPEVQERIMQRFHAALGPQGCLFLGSSETTGNLSDAFRTIHSRSKLFSKNQSYNPPSHFLNYSGSPLHLYDQKRSGPVGDPLKTSKREIMAGLFDEVVGDHLAPSVILNTDHELVHTINDVSLFVKIPKGTMTLNVFKMMDKELALVAHNILRQAEGSKAAVRMANIHLPAIKVKDLLLTAKALSSEVTKRRFYLLSFEISLEKVSSTKVVPAKDISMDQQLQTRIIELEQALQLKSENLQTTIEELETSNEELQSSNEELLASNEELQSTNQELQSVNEELYTVNAELTEKIDELSQMTEDMANLQRISGFGTLFFDQDLIIRRIDDLSLELGHLKRSDIGRSLNELSWDSFYDSFREDVEGVRQNLRLVSKDLILKGNVWYRLTIQPFRTSDHAVDGIVVTLIDISMSKGQDDRISILEDEIDDYKIMFGMSNTGFVIQDEQGNIIEANDAAQHILGLSLDQMRGRDSIDPRWKSIHPDGSDFPGETHPAMVALKTGQAQEDVIMGVLHPHKKVHTWIKINAIPLLGSDKKVKRVIASFNDISAEYKHSG